MKNTTNRYQKPFNIYKNTNKIAFFLKKPNKSHL